MLFFACDYNRNRIKGSKTSNSDTYRSPNKNSRTVRFACNTPFLNILLPRGKKIWSFLWAKKHCWAAKLLVVRFGNCGKPRALLRHNWQGCPIPEYGLSVIWKVENRLHYGEYNINRQRLQVVNVFFWQFQKWRLAKAWAESHNSHFSFFHHTERKRSASYRNEMKMLHSPFLPAAKMVGATGLEPMTSAVWKQHSNQLS